MGYEEIATFGIGDAFSAPLARLTSALETSSKAADRMAERMAALDKSQEAIAAAMSGLAQKFDQFGQAGQRVAQHAEGAGLSVGKMATAFAAASFATDLIQGAVGKLSEVISSIPSAALSMNAAFEQTRIAFVGLLGGAEQADAMLRDLWTFAATTPFEFPQMTQAARTLTAFGFQAQQIIPLMTSVGNIAAGLGAGADVVNRIVYNLGQMNAMGKVTGRELRDLAMAGVNLGDIYAIVARNMGKTTAQIKAMMEGSRGAGALPFSEFMKAFQEFGETKFGNMMAEQAKTFNGAMSTIRDNLSAVVRDGFKPAFDWVSKLAYQFSLFVQGADFSRVTTAISSSLTRLFGDMPVVSADTFSPLVDGAIKLIDVMTRVAVFIKDNLTPIIIGLGTAASLTAVAIGVALVGATGGLVLVIPAIAAGIALLAKVIQDRGRAADAEKKRVDAFTVALGDQGDEYRNLLEQKKILEAQLYSETGATQEVANAYDAVKNRLKELADQAIKTRTEMFPIVGPKEPAVAPSGPMRSNVAWILEEEKVSAAAFERMQVAADELATTIEKTLGDSFGKMAEKAVTAGDRSLDWFDTFMTAMGQAPTATDKVGLAIQAIGEKVKGLGEQAQISIAGKVKAALDGIDPQNAKQKLVGLIQVLDEVTAAAERAADAKRWDEMLTAMSRGVAGVMDKIDAINQKGQEASRKGYGERDFAKQARDIEDYNRKIAETEEKIRRIQGVSTSKKDNWLQPDPDKVKAYERDIEDLKDKIAAATEKTNDMAAANAKAGDAMAEAAMMSTKEWGHFFAAQVLGWEQTGNVSAEQADKMLAGIKSAFGEGLTKNQEFGRAVEKRGQDMQKYVAASAQAANEWFNIIAAASKAKDPVVELNKLTDDFQKKQEGIKEQYRKRIEGNNELQEGAMNVKDEIDKQLEAQDDVNVGLNDTIALETKVLEMAVKIAEKIYPIRFKVTVEGDGGSGGGGGDGGETNPNAHNEGESAGPNLIWHWDANRKRWMRIGGTGSLGAMVGNVFAEPNVPVAQGMAQAARSAEQVVADIQHILSLFAGLSVDPRVKDMADAVSSVVGAFSSGMDALSKLKDYTSPARSAVDAAFADVQYLAGRMLDAATRLVGAFDSEKVSNVASASGNLLSAFGTGVEALALAKDYVAPARSAVDSIVNDIVYVTTALSQRLPQDLSQQAGDALSSIGNGLAAMIEPLAGISRYVGLARDKITGMAPSLIAFMADLQGLFGRLGSLADWLAGQGALKDKMLALGGVLKETMEPTKVALDVLVGIGQYVALARDSEGTATRLADFLLDVQGLFGRLGSLADWLSGQADLKDKMLALGPVMQAVFDPLKDVFEMLKGIREYAGFARPGGGAAPALDAFMEDVRGLFGRLGELAAWLAGQANAQGALAPQMVQLGETLQAIFGGVQQVTSAMSALYDLAEKRVKSALGLDDLIALLASATEGMIIQLARWVDPRTDFALIVAKVKDFAVNLGIAIAPFATVTAAASALFDLAEKMKDRVVDLSDLIAVVASATEGMVVQLAQWADPRTDFSIIVGKVKDFAATLGAVLAPMQTVIGITSGAVDLANRLAESEGSINNALSVLDTVTRQLVLQIKRWWMGDVPLMIGGPTDNPLLDLAETLGKLLSPMQVALTVAGGAVDLATKLAESEGSLTNALHVLDSATRQLVLQLKRWWSGDNPLLIGGVDESKNPFLAFAVTLGKVLAPMQSVISIVSGAIDLSNKLADFEARWAEVQAALDAGVRALLAKMREWATDAGLLADVAAITEGENKEFAANLQKALSPVAAATAALTALMDFSDRIGRKAYDFAAIIERVVLATQDVLRRWRDLAGFDLSAWPEEFSQRMANALQPIQLATATLVNLIDFSSVLGNKVYNWDGIVYQVSGYIYQVLMRWHDLATDRDLLDALEDYPRDFNESLQNALGPIRLTIDTLEAVAKYTGFAARAAGVIPAKIKMLVQDMKDFMTEFAKAAKDLEVDDATKAFGEALQAVVGPVVEYIQAFYWIWRYESIWARSGGRGRPQPSEWIAPQFEALAQDLKQLVKRIYDLSHEIVEGVSMSDMAKDAAEFSEVLTIIVDMANKGLEFIKQIGGAYTVATNEADIDAFVNLLRGAVIQFADMFDDAGDLMQQLNDTFFTAGLHLGDSLASGIIQGARNRRDDVQDAINDLVGSGDLAHALDGARTVNITQTVNNNVTANQQFTGDIYPSNLRDVERLVDLLWPYLQARMDSMARQKAQVTQPTY